MEIPKEILDMTFVNPLHQDNKTVHQLMLEKLYSKNQLIPRIQHEIISSKNPDLLKMIKDAGLDQAFGVSLLVQMVLHKRTTVSTLVGILRHHFTTLQECADALLKAAEADLVDWNTSLNQFIIVYDISKDVQDDLDKFQFPLPMVVKPKEIRTNRDTGYLVADPSSIILRKNHHNDDVCLDHINRVNSYRFTIDQDTALMIKNRWRNLDKPKEGESKQDYQKRVKAFEKYDRTAKEVIDLIVEHGSDFYLTHRVDKRGRTYCQGYHITYQGAAWNKATIELADKEIVP